MKDAPLKDRLKNPALLGAIAAALAIAVLLIVLLGGSDEPEKVTFNEFQDHIDNDEVVKVKLKDRSNLIEGELTDGTKIKVQFPGEFGDELTTMITEAEPTIEFESDPEKQSFWAGLFYSLLPVIVLVGVFLFVLNMMQGGGRGVMQFGKAKARKFSKDEPQVTFEDVAGADEAIEELREIKDFLQEPKKFQAMGAKIPKGVLLYGPPGTGKTLLARAVAGEAGAPFFSISGSDFVEMFVGVGASRVRDLFEQAKTAAPAIIFVDEIDAVGRHRGAGMGGGHDEREQTLNQLLVEMDGFDVTTGVILIAATNRPDILDPALLRPGRFDRQIAVGVPDIAGREKILEVHAKGKPLDKDIELATVARRTAGFSGADLANLMNEGALLAARREKPTIGQSELDEAMERVIAGPERKTNVMSDRERRIIAYHESGHAIVGQVLQHTDPIHKVTIIPRGRALGYTLSLPVQDKFLHSQSELCDLMAMALGGRAAEELVFGDITSGASDDIKKVTSIARSMVMQYGMSTSLGPRLFGGDREEVFQGMNQGGEVPYSDEVAAHIDTEINRLIDVAHQEAIAILTHHRATLDELANELMERESLDEDELRAIFGEKGSWESSASSRPAPGFGGSTPNPAPIGEYRSTEAHDRARPTNPPENP